MTLAFGLSVRGDRNGMGVEGVAELISRLIRLGTGKACVS